MSDGLDRTPDCLDAETIAALIDHTLSTDARRSAEGHIASCAVCYEAFTETAAMSAEMPGVAPFGVDGRLYRLTRRPAGTMVAASLLAAAAAVWLAVMPPDWLVVWWNPNSRPEIRPLVAALGDHRILGGRMTGGFAWSPPRAALRSGSMPVTELNPESRIVIAEIEQALARNRRPRTLAAHATARLTLGDADGAVNALREAVVEDDGNASFWSDLSAAYLARASAPDRSVDLPQALEAAERALRLDADHPEATFNKALALERLNVLPQAIAAWERYLELDPASGWAAEAREHLDKLRAASKGARVDSDMQPVRERLFDVTLLEWAIAVRRRDPPAAGSALAAAEEAVSLLSAVAGDGYAADVLAALRATPGQSRQDGLADGLIAYGRARQAYRQDDFDVSAPQFAAARIELERARNPLALSAAIHEAVIAYRRRDFARSAAILQQTRVAMERRRYANLLGRIDWTLGLLAFFEGRAARSISLYESAISHLESAAEPANAAFVRGLLASVYDWRGDVVRTWQVRVRSLEGTGREGPLMRAAAEAMRSNWRLAALVFATAAVERADAGQRAATRADALRLQAVIHHALDEREPARARLAEARLTLSTGVTGPAADRLRAEMDLTRAMTAEDRALEDGLAAAARALHYFTSTTPASLERLPEIHLVAARLRRRAGDSAGALTSLQAGITTLFRLRHDVAPGTEQATFSEIVRQLVDEIVDLASQGGDTDSAFLLAEQARAWDLPERAIPAPLRLDQIVEAVAPGTVLLDYVVSEQRSFAWIITATRSRFVVIPAGRAVLERLVRAAMPPRLDRAAAARLRELLLSPGTDALASANAIAIVADGPLHQLSFAALPGAARPYLIEEHALRYLPSAVFLGRPESRPRLPHTPVLIVGNPALDAATHAALPSLDSAATEAITIASGYPLATLLLNEHATRSAFVERLPHSAVVHFAGHAVVNHLNASESALQLAGSADDRLTAREIRALSLERTRLVVLSACETAAGFMTQSQGPMSLARAFLSAGVQTLVASLWPVSDTASARMLSLFHEQYRRTGSAAVALREAQVSMLRSSGRGMNTPADWGAFVVVGDDSGARSFHGR